MLHENPVIVHQRDLVEYEIQKLLTGEIQLQKHIPAWAHQAVSPQLKKILADCLELARQHINMMGSFLDKEYIMLRAFPNEVMGSFIKEADQKLSFCQSAATKDAGLLVSILSINEYKLSSYNATAYVAEVVGMKKQAEIFRKSAGNEQIMKEQLLRLEEYSTIY